MMPFSLTEHKATLDLMKTITAFQLPTRKTLTKEIELLFNNGKKSLVNLLHNQRYCATTADSWTAHNRAFMGVTVHYIDEDTLKRQKGVLACRELKESQTGRLLGKILCEIHEEFGLSDKIKACTTDNGANYVAAFVHQGTHPEELVTPSDSEDDDSDTVPRPQIAELDRILSDSQNLLEDNGYHLPPHYRCW